MTKHISEDSKQFTDPRLVEVYDTVNALGEDAVFWCSEIEKLAPTTIIDFGCGTGLLTCDLANRGYTMIGIDPAGPMLEIAKTKQCSGKIQWIEGGYEALKGLKTDLFLMTSHVAQFFLKDEDWQAMLKAAYDTLTPNGHILFDSRRSLKESFAKWPTQDSRTTVIDPVRGKMEYWVTLLETTTDKIGKYTLHYLFTETGEEIVSEDAIIFRSKEEIETLLKEAGFTLKTVYGDWDGTPFTKASPEMLFLAQKN